MNVLIDEMELLASVFASSLDAKLIIFANGKVYRANRKAEEIFLGPGETELQGKNILSILSGTSKKNLKSFLNALKDQHEVHREVEIKSNGEWKVFDIVASASVVESLSLINMRDVTEKVREKEARDEFIAVAGHEIKTPLAVVSAYTDLLRRKHKNDAYMMLYLNKILEKNKILASYIESILDEIRIGAGRFTFEDKEYDFDTIINETIKELKKEHPRAIIEKHGQTDKRVFVDSERISQVVRNLVANAIKHSPKNKTIHIETMAKGGNVRFMVRDQGKGVPIKEQPLIFKAFYRSKTKHNRKKSGLGLGLYISKRIILQYNGQIGVESKAGKGAKFFFEIPYSKK